MGQGTRKADDVALTLLDQIVSGERAVGSVLPTEAELAEQFGVNRGAVREANKLLEVHRLVKPVRRRGTEVLDPMQSLTPEVLKAMLVDRRGRVNVDMLGHFLELRAVLDVEMGRLAAERRTEKDLVALDACVDRIAECVGCPEDFDAELHELGLTLARATQNPIFVMLSHWNRQIYGYLGSLLGSVRQATEQQVVAYRSLVAAVRRQDVETLTQMVSAFHSWANQELLLAAKSWKPPHS
ncbi:MAG: FadR family transcriptional regulator [Polyangiaceae bacterium]|nr:FadR family transcriptional regulator [Polyangiaceae bacterium]